MELNSILQNLIEFPGETETYKYLDYYCRAADYGQGRELVKRLSSLVKSPTPTDKFQGVKILIFAMETGNPHILLYSLKKTIPRLVAYTTESEKDFEDELQREASNSVRKLTLSSIKSWATRFKKFEGGVFYQLYKQLRLRGVVFDFNKSRYKRLRHHIKKVIHEIYEGLESPGQIQKLIENLKECHKFVLIEDIPEVRGMIEECLASCSNKVLLSECKIEDEECLPKPMPVFPTNTSIEANSEASELIDESFRNQKHHKLKEALMEKEELVQFYRNDLTHMQNMYLEVANEREELKLNVKRLKEVVEEMKKDYEKKESRMMDDIITYKTKSESVEALLKQMHGNLLKLEAEDSRKQLAIESLEQMNCEVNRENQILKQRLRSSSS